MITRPAKFASSQGLLLVEAVLSAVVIAVGLVFISRGLANQLKTLQRLEQYDGLLSLAREKLLELETDALTTHTLPPAKSGTCEAPFADYRWTITTKAYDLLKDPSDQPLAREIILSIRQGAGRTSVRLSALWPIEWIPSEWR
ncbi:MAG: hypothetical protein HY352_05755 [Candidatus Omnitrophica bacterium]|nr:hypothetical protein [Candidatus Omnitrophota bacterium]